MGSAPREVVVISSSDEEEEVGSGDSPAPLGWAAKLGDSAVPAPRRHKGRSRGVRAGNNGDCEGDDCVVLDGDPDKPVAVAGAKGRSRRDGESDGAEIVAVKGEEMDGRPQTVYKTAATRGARTEETPSPHPSRPVFSSFKIYVDNLPWKVSNSNLKQLFSDYGEVVGAKVVYHRGREAGRSPFGFVTMATRQESENAIWHLNKQVWWGRKLRVQVAREEGTR